MDLVKFLDNQIMWWVQQSKIGHNQFFQYDGQDSQYNQLVAKCYIDAFQQVRFFAIGSFLDIDKELKR